MGTTARKVLVFVLVGLIVLLLVKAVVGFVVRLLVIAALGAVVLFLLSGWRRSDRRD